MRLTKKGKTIPYTREYADADCIRKITRKLGQIEDIEDELGVELLTLARASKEGIYVDEGKYCHTNDLVIRYVEGEKLSFRSESIDFFLAVQIYYYKDYGKTWALTKEELEEKK